MIGIDIGRVNTAICCIHLERRAVLEWDVVKLFAEDKCTPRTIAQFLPEYFSALLKRHRFSKKLAFVEMQAISFNGLQLSRNAIDNWTLEACILVALSTLGVEARSISPLSIRNQLGHSGKGSYSKSKQASVNYAQNLIDDGSLSVPNDFLEMFHSADKKDDLADSLVLCWGYMRECIIASPAVSDS